MYHLIQDEDIVGVESLYNYYKCDTKVLLNLDYDGDKVYRTSEKMLLDAYEENLPIIISPLEDYKAPSNTKLTISVIESVGLKQLDARTLDNQTGLYTNMGSYYINKYYTIIHKYKNALNRFNIAIQNRDVMALNELAKELYPNTHFESIQAFSAKIQKDFIYKKNLYDYKLTIIRIAQAGEIDYPKHGVRFVLPKNVITNAKLHWLDPIGFNKRQQSLKSKGKPQMEILDTPFERLYAHLNKRADELKTNNRISTKDVRSYFLNFDNIDKDEFVRILPQIKELFAKYNEGVQKIRNQQKNTKNYFDNYSLYVSKKEEKLNNVNKAYSNFYTKLREKAETITNDIKTLASACYYVACCEDEKGKENKFPFIIAFEGLIANLADTSTLNNIKVIPVESLDTLGRNLEGDVVIKEGIPCLKTTGEILKEFDGLSLNDGIYNLFNFRGKHYLSVPYVLTKEDKDAIVSHYCNKRLIDNMNRSIPTSTTVKVNKNIPINLTIVGTEKNGITPQQACELIQANNNNISFTEILIDSNIKGIEEEKIPYVGIKVGSYVLGTIDRYDRFKIKDNNLIILDDFIGHIAKVTKIEPVYNKAGTKITSIKLEVVIQTSNFLKDKELDDVHKLCDISSWYWNREWFKLSDFNIINNGTQIRNVNPNPSIGETFARIIFTRDNNQYYAYIAKNNVGLSLVGIQHAQSQQMIDLSCIDDNLASCFLRIADYSVNQLKIQKLIEKEKEIEKIG